MRRFGAIVSSESQPTVIYKTADQTVNNSDVLQDDTALILALTPGVYYFAFDIWFSTDSTADFKYTQAYTSTQVARYFINEFIVPTGVSMTRTEVLTTFGAQTVNGSAGTHGYVRTHGVLEVSGSGNLKLQWAQGTQNASDTKVLKGSRLSVYKVS